MVGLLRVYLQPSEPLKFLLVVYLAAYLADRLPLITLPAKQTGQTQPGSQPEPHGRRPPTPTSRR